MRTNTITVMTSTATTPPTTAPTSNPSSVDDEEYWIVAVEKIIGNKSHSLCILHSEVGLLSELLVAYEEKCTVAIEEKLRHGGSESLSLFTFRSRFLGR